MARLDWDTYTLPLAFGLDTDKHKFALEIPKLAVCKNVSFDEIGALRKRLPFTALASETLTNPKALAVYKRQLLGFTDEELYSYSASASTWEKQADYVAPVVTEEQKHVRPSDQVCADRAEQGGVVYHTWLELGGDNPGWYLTMIDADTGTVLYGPNLRSSDSADRFKLFALGSRVAMLQYDDSANGLLFYVFDPTNTTGTTADFETIASVASTYFDAVYVSGDTALYGAVNSTTATDYVAFKYTDAGTLTTNTITVTDADGPYAVADSAGAGFNVYYWESTGGTIQWDSVNKTTLARTAVSTVATVAQPNQLAALKNSNRADPDVFWSVGESTTDSASFLLRYYQGATNTHTVARQLALVSKPFEYNDDTYIWAAFASENAVGSTADDLGFRAQLQNTYFLIRCIDIQSSNSVYHYTAKAAAQVGGGFAHKRGLLPEVQNTTGNKFKWAGIQRRVIPLGDDAFDKIQRLRPPNPGTGIGGTGTTAHGAGTSRHGVTRLPGSGGING